LTLICQHDVLAYANPPRNRLTNLPGPYNNDYISHSFAFPESQRRLGRELDVA
jgi:hypothetical protein